MTKYLLNRLCKIHPSLKKEARLYGGHFIIEKISSEEADAMILDINSIIYSDFEGRIKEAEFTYVAEYRYFTCRAIKETALVAA